MLIFLVTMLLPLIIRRKAELFTIHIILVAIVLMVLVMYPVILSAITLKLQERHRAGLFIIIIQLIV